MALGVLGVGVSLLLASTAFFRWRLGPHGPVATARFSFHHFLGVLPGSLAWLVPFVGLSMATLVFRAVQWRATLPEPVPFSDRYHLVAIGAFVHNALPGKLGDITRAFLMARTRRLPFLVGLGSVALCKLLEFAALMVVMAAACLGPLGRQFARFREPLAIAVGVCVALLVLVLLLARYAVPLSHRLERGHRFPRLHKRLRELGSGFGAARSGGRLAFAFALSLPPVLAPAFGYGLGLSAFGIAAGLFAGPVVLGAIALGQSVLVVPAGMGLYYFVTSWSARALGATADQAAVYATLTHLGTLFAQLGMGAVSLWVKRIRWSDLRRRADLAAEAEAHVDDDFEAARA